MTVATRRGETMCRDERSHAASCRRPARPRGVASRDSRAVRLLLIAVLGCLLRLWTEGTLGEEAGSEGGRRAGSSPGGIAASRQVAASPFGRPGAAVPLLRAAGPGSSVGAEAAAAPPDGGQAIVEFRAGPPPSRNAGPASDAADPAGPGVAAPGIDATPLVDPPPPPVGAVLANPWPAEATKKAAKPKPRRKKRKKAAAPIVVAPPVEPPVELPVEPPVEPPPPPATKKTTTSLRKRKKKKKKVVAAVPGPLLTKFPQVQKPADFVQHLATLPSFTKAIQVGASNGMIAKNSLENWPSCTEYHLVDAWEGEDQPLLGQAQYRVRSWPEVARFVVAPPDEAAQRLPDARFDYVYLDGRRDYCRTAEEIARWWPKLRPGGILGGNNYVDAAFARQKLKQEEGWGECADGSDRPEAARGAVDDFRREQGGLDVYRTQEFLPSWYIQKPY